EIAGTDFRNKWEVWVYPSKQVPEPGNVLITEKLDKVALSALANGKPVLLLTYGKVAKDKGAEVAIGFSSIFWNTAWTGNQAPHTLGVLCNPDHPVFNCFPTEYHSNWQWWDPVSHSQAMVLDGFPEKLKPLIQPIDTWFENRRLALAFESKTYGGRLMVCSIDFRSLKDRYVSRQLLISMLRYMNSGQFNPSVEVSVQEIRSLVGN
ncbi:MAG TPA: beta-galactosidase, partial [Bacteroidales bacterium]|nr:beta-galactosidase [Bacteroidales bacterium]